MTCNHAINFVLFLSIDHGGGGPLELAGRLHNLSWSEHRLECLLPSWPKHTQPYTGRKQPLSDFCSSFGANSPKKCSSTIFEGECGGNDQVTFDALWFDVKFWKLLHHESCRCLQLRGERTNERIKQTLAPFTRLLIAQIFSFVVNKSH